MLGFIGVGHLATVIINSILENKIELPENIIIYDKIKAQTDKIDGVSPAGSEAELCNLCDIIFLAVRPADVQGALIAMKDTCIEKTLVSCCAGISTEFIGRTIKNCNIIRVMPNTPMMLEKGASAVANNSCGEQINKEITRIFEKMGVVKYIPEEQMDIATAVSGSGPAYFYYFIKTIADFAKDRGMDYDIALALATATMDGAAEMLAKSGFSPEELLTQVATPNGTTIQALNYFDECNIKADITEALEKCRLKARGNN